MVAWLEDGRLTGEEYKKIGGAGHGNILYLICNSSIHSSEFIGYTLEIRAFYLWQGFHNRVG